MKLAIQWSNTIKGIVHPPKKIAKYLLTLKASYECLIFLLQTNTFRVIFHIVLSVSICINAVNGAPVFESEKKSIRPSQNYSTRLWGACK